MKASAMKLLHGSDRAILRAGTKSR
jgi:transposase